MICQERIYVGLVDPPTASEAIARNFPIADHVLDRARCNCETPGKRLDGVEGLLPTLNNVDLVHQARPFGLMANRAPRQPIPTASVFASSSAVSSRSAFGRGSAAIGRDGKFLAMPRDPVDAALGSR